MKIYNEVILNWNNETQQYDVVFEDSFNHQGEIYHMKDGDSRPDYCVKNGYVNEGGVGGNCRSDRNCLDDYGLDPDDGYYCVNGLYPDDRWFGCCVNIYPTDDSFTDPLDVSCEDGSKVECCSDINGTGACDVDGSNFTFYFCDTCPSGWTLTPDLIDECIDSSDCGNGEYCSNGVCNPLPIDDGINTYIYDLDGGQNYISFPFQLVNPFITDFMATHSQVESVQVLNPLETGITIDTVDAQCYEEVCYSQWDEYDGNECVFNDICKPDSYYQFLNARDLQFDQYQGYWIYTDTAFTLEVEGYAVNTDLQYIVAANQPDESEHNLPEEVNFLNKFSVSFSGQYPSVSGQLDENIYNTIDALGSYAEFVDVIVSAGHTYANTVNGWSGDLDNLTVGDGYYIVWKNDIAPLYFKWFSDESPVFYDVPDEPPTPPDADLLIQEVNVVQTADNNTIIVNGTIPQFSGSWGDYGGQLLVEVSNNGETVGIADWTETNDNGTFEIITEPFTAYGKVTITVRVQLPNGDNIEESIILNVDEPLTSDPIETIYGCMDDDACNYNSNADNSLEGACNYGTQCANGEFECDPNDCPEIPEPDLDEYLSITDISITSVGGGTYDVSVSVEVLDFDAVDDGTFNVQFDWGDGTTTNIENVPSFLDTHNYNSTGTKTIGVDLIYGSSTVDTVILTVEIPEPEQLDPVYVSGCTDPNAANYDVDATLDNGTCTYDYSENISIDNISIDDLTVTINVSVINIDDISETFTISDDTDTYGISDDGTSQPFITTYGDYGAQTITFVLTDSNGGEVDTLTTTITLYGPYTVYYGCTTSSACNYNSGATLDDGSCFYTYANGEIYYCIPNGDGTSVKGGCITDTDGDGICNQLDMCVSGDVDDCGICNGNNANMDNCGVCYGSCNPVDEGNENGTVGCYECWNGSLECLSTDCSDVPIVVEGCTYEDATNYNSNATIDDGTCEFNFGVIAGCTDPNAGNYNSDAIYDDGSCEYPIEETNVTDIDGNVYQTVQIGDQLWMAENLRVTHYNNGDGICDLTADINAWAGCFDTWPNTEDGAYSYVDSDNDNSETYGLLYNGYAVDEDRGICPDGWIIPQQSDFNLLKNFIISTYPPPSEMPDNEGTHLKSEDWDGDNVAGFNALPAGYRGQADTGLFLEFLDGTRYWTSTNTNSSKYFTKLETDVTTFNISSQAGFKHGHSVRCIYLPTNDCNGVPGGDAYLDDCGTCVGGTTNNEPNYEMDNCGVCNGNNSDDLGCGCNQDAPTLYYVDSDNDAYNGDPFDGGVPNPDGDVDATQPYYFCTYEGGDVILAYGNPIEYPDTLGETLTQPPTLDFNYPEWKPAYPNFVPDWLELTGEFPVDVMPGDPLNPQDAGTWYGTYIADNNLEGCEIYGCTDSVAINYNPDATIDDGTCQHPVGPLENTNLPIVEIVGGTINIYKSELDEQVSISEEFEIFNDTFTTSTLGIYNLNGGNSTYGNENGDLNLPYSNYINLIPLIDNFNSMGNITDDYTLSKTALTNYLFDEMGNQIVDFKYVDLVVNDEYMGTHLFYPEPSLSVLGMIVPEPTGPIVINEFMAVNGSIDNEDMSDQNDWVEFYNTSSDEFNLSTGNYYLGDDGNNQLIQSPICYLPGCTDNAADNYNSQATHSDSSACIYGGLPSIIFTQINTKQGCGPDDCGWGGQTEDEYYSPTYTEASREFVELYNPNPDPILLNEYKFTDAFGGGNFNADTTSLYEICSEGTFKTWDGSDKGDCVLESGQYLVIYQDYKYGVCLYDDGTYGDFCSNDNHCTIGGGEEPCTQCLSDGNTNCYNPGFLVNEEWECDGNCSTEITISKGTEPSNNNSEFAFKTVTELKPKNANDGGELEVKFDRNENTYGNPFVKGELVYLNVPVATVVGDVNNESTIMTGIYYACDNGEWDEDGRWQGIALCCYDGTEGASPTEYIWGGTTYDTYCKSSCAEEQTLGTCSNDNPDGSEIFPTDGTAFYVENYRLADDDILSGNNGMGLGDPEAIYVLDASSNPISSVIEFEDGENNWPNVNSENMLGLKHPNCGQDSPYSWETRVDGVISLGQTIDEFSSDSTCTSWYSEISSEKYCSGGPNKGLSCSTNEYCHFKVQGQDRFIAWYVDDGDYPLCEPTYMNVEQQSDEIIYTCQDINVPFKLSSDGDAVKIYKDGIADENLMDEYEFGLQISDVSMQRCESDGVGRFVTVQYTFDGDGNITYGSFNETNYTGLCVGTLLKFEDGISLLPPVEGQENIIIDNLISDTYTNFVIDVNKNSYLDYVLLQELRMGNGEDGFNYDNIYVIYDGEKFNFGPLDSLESTDSFFNGFDVKQCQGEEYKVDTTSLDSSGWLFDNFGADTDLVTQLKSFIETSDDFLTDLIERWNELRGGVLSDEHILHRIDYYYYYLDDRSTHNYKLGDYKDSIFDEEINNLRTWLMNRIYWIDHNIRRIKHQSNDTGECVNDPLFPIGVVGETYCNDVNAKNTNTESNFNDGTCQYVLNRELQFQLDTQNVGYPKIEKVRLNILTKNGIDFDESYEMEQTVENIWFYDLFDFLPGDIFTYNYTKETPDVYNVQTGPLETDKVRTIQIRDENQIEIKDTFNDFVDEFQETNLPIIKLNTNTFNDMGFVDDNNPNLFYCPSYILESEYLADGPTEEMCGDMKSYIKWYEDELDEDGNDSAGYYQTKQTCETQTICDVDCIDGTNIQDEPKIAGFFELIYNGEGAINNINDEPQLSTKVGIEARGYSSRGFAKKQYAMELQETKPFPQCDDDAANYNLFCDGFKPEEGVDYGDECIFNKENDFVLLGPFRDRTYMRNAITYELWDRMGNIGTNSKFFEFILNDVYMGLYVMFEKPKIDEHRVPIETEITDADDGGWMVKLESGGEQDYFIGYDSYTKYEFYDPDPGDGLSSDNQQSITNQITTLEEMVDAGSESQITNLMDIKTFSEYWLIQEFARNNEGFTRSQYWHSFGNYAPEGYDNDKIYISYVWDMNHAFAATIINPDGWATQNFFAIPQVWVNLFKSSWFQQEIYDRYAYLKNTLPVFNVSEINKLINKFSDEMLSYNAVNRDQKRWYDGEIGDFNIYLKNFRKYILQRISWMDIHICQGGISSDVDNTIFNETELQFTTCPNDDKNSNFLAIYNPYEGQVFDIDEIGNEFEIEMIVSLNLIQHLEGIVITITDASTQIIVHTFPSIEIDNSGYVNLIWNTYDRRISGKLIGDYTIEADLEGYNITLEENIKNFSIRNIGKTSGCIDSRAVNYNLFADIDDGSCKYQQQCNEKYNVSEFITEVIYLYPGYNTISYPLDFTGVDVDLFKVLNNSYYDDSGGKTEFEENDFITAFFDDVVYTATYMGDEWIPSTNRGFSLNEVSKGIGFILYVSNGGRIIWDIPKGELS